jgi:O-antigen ligase
MYPYLSLIFLIPYQVHSIFSISILGLSVIKWVGICTLISAFLKHESGIEKPGLFDSPTAKLFGLYCLVPFILWLAEGEWQIGSAEQSYLSFFLFFYVTMKLVSSREHVNQVIWALVISMFVGSLYIIREFFTYRGAMGFGFRTFGATFGDPNYYALSAILILPFIYYLFKYSHGLLKKYGLIGMMVVFSSGIFITQSRGALLGLAVMLFIAFLMSSKKLKALLVISLVVLIGLAVAPDNLRKRFSETKVTEDKAVSGDEASTTRRWSLLLAGIEMIKDKPLTGVGLGRFKEKSIIYYPKLGFPGIAHSTYISITAELGIPQMLLFCMIAAFTFRGLFRLKKMETIKGEDLLLINTLIVSLSGFLASCAFLSGEYTKIFWILVFLTIKLKTIFLDQDQELACVCSMETGASHCLK